MAKNKDIIEAPNKLNQISKKADICFNIVFIILALICIIPVIFIFIISISSEESIRHIGYQVLFLSRFQRILISSCIAKADMIRRAAWHLSYRNGWWVQRLALC